MSSDASGRRVARLALVCGVAALAACEKDVVGVCEVSINFQTYVLRPSLRVGDTTTMRSSATTCDGHRQIMTSWRYTAANPTIARVDSVSGLITALAAGSTFINARRMEIPHPETGLTLTVTP